MRDNSPALATSAPAHDSTATPLSALPALRADTCAVRALFESGDPALTYDLPNPHLEPQVSALSKARARAASVLIVLVEGAWPHILLTKRTDGIRYGGHQVFPGGLSDTGDRTPLDTGLRETFEEIGLPAERIEVLGRLANYHTHSGYCIAAYVGVTRAPLELRLSRGEVASVSEVPLHYALDGKNYTLRVRSRSPFRANYNLNYGSTHITGPTVSLLISLYRALVRLTRT